MPELPEVETVRVGIEPVLLGGVLSDVVINRFDLRGGIPEDFAERVKGAVITRTERRGKYIFIVFDNGQLAVLHLGMSGRIRIYKADEDYVPEKHDHVVLRMQGGARVVFNDPRRFGMLYLVAVDEIDNVAPFALMGPEPLGNGFSGAVLHERLAGKRGPIKSALLDQRVVAGLGNIYVCEALYRVRVSPFRVAGQVSAAECDDLARAIRDVLNAALASGGSSLKDYRQADGELGYFQHSFDVYGREGEACKNCKAPIERSVQSGRSTFYCTQCQV